MEKNKSDKIKDENTKTGDVGGWFYSDEVKRHFFDPYKFMKDSEEEEFAKEADGVGMVGSPACGDMMKLWIKVDPVRNGRKEHNENQSGDNSTSNGVDKNTQKIKDCRWRTFGCGSAIASTSALAEMITENGGMSIEDAIKITPQDIMARLGGLPDIKIHCSVLGDQALRAAIDDYLNKKHKDNK